MSIVDLARESAEEMGEVDTVIVEMVEVIDDEIHAIVTVRMKPDYKNLTIFFSEER